MRGSWTRTCLVQGLQALNYIKNSIQVAGVQLGHGTWYVLLAATQEQLRLTTVGPQDTSRHRSTHEAGRTAPSFSLLISWR